MTPHEIGAALKELTGQVNVDDTKALDMLARKLKVCRPGGKAAEGWLEFQRFVAEMPADCVGGFAWLLASAAATLAALGQAGQHGTLKELLKGFGE